MGEPVVAFDFSMLEIEHIMPQTWERHWPLPIAENARTRREHALHGIGNLTLVSSKLNPTLSNAGWLESERGTPGKREALEQHARLQLNHRLVKNYPDTWIEASIERRALELFDAACAIWPEPKILATGIVDKRDVVDSHRLRPIEWDDVPGPIEFVPLILKFMLRGEIQSSRIQDEIRFEKRLNPRNATGSGKEKGTPDDSPSNKFQNNFDWAIGRIMQNELKLIAKMTMDSNKRSGMGRYQLLPRAYEYIEEQGWSAALLRA
jgi:hypothetical protein